MNTWRKFRTYRDVQSPILNTLYWDGIMYMFWIILLTGVNMSVIVAAPAPYISAFDTAQVALQSAFASRIFFNLRECDERIHHGGSGTEMSLDPLQFSPHCWYKPVASRKFGTVRLALSILMYCYCDITCIYIHVQTMFKCLSMDTWRTIRRIFTERPPQQAYENYRGDTNVYAMVVH